MKNVLYRWFGATGILNIIEMKCTCINEYVCKNKSERQLDQISETDLTSTIKKFQSTSFSWKLEKLLVVDFTKNVLFAKLV